MVSKKLHEIWSALTVVCSSHRFPVVNFSHVTVIDLDESGKGNTLIFLTCSSMFTEELANHTLDTGDDDKSKRGKKKRHH